MIKKLSYLLSEYKVLRTKLDEKTSFKTTLKAIFSSILINLVIFLIPALLVYNLFIIDKIIPILKVIIILLIIAFTFSYNYFYIKVVKNYEESIEAINFKHLIIVESVIGSLFLSILAIVIMTIIWGRYYVDRIDNNRYINCIRSSN